MTTATTYHGQVTIETAVPLTDLHLGDFVLGTDTDELPFRTLHQVTAELGMHHVPVEGNEPLSLLDRVIRLFSRKIAGVLVDGINGDEDAGADPGLFALATTPTLDRLIVPDGRDPQ